MMVCQSAPPASAPEPRLTARSMLSFGTELFFAFWIASNRVGLPAGSPPPVRAATSIFLIIFAKSLPRLASITAFLCLVVAHLEWPDIALRSFFHVRVRSLAHAHSSLPCSAGRPDQLREHAVDPVVPGQLRVEGRRQQIPLPNGDDPTCSRPATHTREHLDAVRALVHRLDPRRP